MTAKRLCYNFGNFLTENEDKILESTVFLISGDFWDGLLFHPSEDTRYIYSIMIRILEMCHRGNTKLRILDGTQTHDWGQGKAFIYLADAFKGEVDVEFIEVMAIEFFGDNSLLYVPDELNHQSIDTYLQAKELIAENGLEQVDYATIHGGFKYQLDYPGVDSHDEVLWTEIVKYLIITGHYHVSVPYGIIVPNGSFDALVFGESRDKGGWLFTKVGEVVYKERLPNKDVIIFEILKVSEDITLEVAMSELKALIESLPEDSYISIRPHKNHPINKLLKEIKHRYPKYNFYKESYGEDEVVFTEVQYEVVEINSGNLLDVYSTFIDGHADAEALTELLGEVVNA